MHVLKLKLSFVNSLSADLFGAKRLNELELMKHFPLFLKKGAKLHCFMNYMLSQSTSHAINNSTLKQKYLLGRQDLIEIKFLHCK